MATFGSTGIEDCRRLASRAGIFRKLETAQALNCDALSHTVKYCKISLRVETPVRCTGVFGVLTDYLHLTNYSDYDFS